MRKALIILTVLTLIGMAGGGLYATLADLDSVGNEVNEYAALDPFPYEMPEVVMYPAPGCLLF